MAEAALFTKSINTQSHNHVCLPHLQAKVLRVMADGRVIPPACVDMVYEGADVVYAPNYDALGHKPRPPSWQLAPNRLAGSNTWVSSAALAFL